MNARGGGISRRDKCPYCEHPFEIEARDIRGDLLALQCIDCREAFVVQVEVTVTHRVRALADVNADDVLDELSGIRGERASDRDGDGGGVAESSDDADAISAAIAPDDEPAASDSEQAAPSPVVGSSAKGAAALAKKDAPKGSGRTGRKHPWRQPLVFKAREINGTYGGES